MIAGNEFHEEEGHIGHGVAGTKGLVELDAVDDQHIFRRGTIREKVDVIEPQIAVVLARNSPTLPGSQSLAAMSPGYSL